MFFVHDKVHYIKEINVTIGDFDTSNHQILYPEEEKALEMAQEFRRYCEIHNFKDSLMLAGVAWKGNFVKNTAFDNGVNHQKKLIKDKLGL